MQSVVRDALSRRSVERKLGGLPDGPEESVSKILMAKYNQTRTELELDLLGAHGMLADTTGELTGIPGAAKSYLRARPIPSRAAPPRSSRTCSPSAS
jgi:hypothetical protein